MNFEELISFEALVEEKGVEGIPKDFVIFGELVSSFFPFFNFVLLFKGVFFFVKSINVSNSHYSTWYFLLLLHTLCSMI